jgi:transposase-like protein
MSYCPEDGTKMEKVSEQVAGEVVYRCPDCAIRWHYFDGTYTAEMPEAEQE